MAMTTAPIRHFRRTRYYNTRRAIDKIRKRTFVKFRIHNVHEFIIIDLSVYTILVLRAKCNGDWYIFPHLRVYVDYSVTD